MEEGLQEEETVSGERGSLVLVISEARGRMKNCHMGAEGPGTERLSTFTDPRAPLSLSYAPSKESKIQQQGAPVNSKGKECLLRALP